ncbi:uncharacterized protein FIBRA_04004 [Fibroporia radiculosa]|uniref:RanBD1 domain-containing protein n=1 Tax=Fibroporia radiculosa TaxID=599839 RepID=J4I9X7_9APHY|nr:uncharacterized protein FIBRA_04004 [Fibroporia radiculosa]CCM01931.1 predicted protein [Fibroporia radiculosa]
MKRSADKQLTKDDAEDDEEIEESSPGQGFRRADQTELSRRPIKGLPRRSMAGAAAAGSAAPRTVPAPSVPALSSTAEPPPKFSSFSGFGATTNSSTSFSFAAPTTQAPSTQPPPSASTFIFGPSSNTSGIASVTASGPPVAPSASRATKTFASFLSAAPDPPATKQKLDAAPTDAEDDALREEVRYLLALRGLNTSFLSAVAKAVESDPFIDIAGVLEQYKNMRLSAQTEYDEKVKTIRSASTESRLPSWDAATSTKPPAASPSAPSLGSAFMPKPPSSFTGFGASTISSPPAPTSSSSVADAAKTSSSTTGFTFGSSSGASNTSGNTTGFTLSPSSSASNTSASTAPAPPKSAFTFGSSGSSSSSSSPFSLAQSTSSPFGATASPFSSGTSPQSMFGFGKSDSSTIKAEEGASSKSNSFAFSNAPPSGSASIFGKLGDDKDKTKDVKDEEAAAQASSGSTSGSSLFGGTSVFATPEKSTTSFTFGAASSAASTKFGGFSGFGKAGSIGNPVGFNFGSPPKTPDGETATIPSKLPTFTFGSSAKSDSGKALTEENASGESGTSTPAPEAEAEPQPQLISTSVHDMEGEGEENEVTTHEIRSKVFKMMKRDGKNEWSDLGVGVLRLKTNNDTDARRILLRNSSTGKITINFIIYSGMNATVSKNTVSFIGHNEGTSTPYRIRTKTEEQANALKSALDREIEFVRGKSQS